MSGAPFQMSGNLNLSALFIIIFRRRLYAEQSYEKQLSAELFLHRGGTAGMSMHLIVSNRPEVLADRFLHDIYLRRTPEDFFTPETVVVQTQGMGAWLNLRLADCASAAANVNTPFLNSFIDSVLSVLLPSDGHRKQLTRDRMFWKIFHALLKEPENYPEAARYMTGDDRIMKACQLAEKTAGLFDQYQIYHSDMLAEWRISAGSQAQSWQARLFRSISEGDQGRDEQFIEFLQKDFSAEQFHSLPRRVSLFGISTLAPLYFEFFRKLSVFIEVNFFYLNPSSEYWSDNLTRREAVREALRSGTDPEQLMTGNPLLTSLGRQGRDFFRYLMQSVDNLDEFSDFESFARTVLPDPQCEYQYENATILSSIQQDIFQNISRIPSERKQPGDPFSGTPLEKPSAPDDSLSIHSCHSEMRQVEVLHDQLLHLIENEGIDPRGILVMAPDISTFEPYIHAVFGTGPLKNQYSVSDRSARQLNRCADSLLKVLQMMSGKFEVSAVFDLLENPELAECWNFSEQDIQVLRHWIEKLGVHWGVDAENHRQFCGVAFDEFSWKPALERLLLGHAVAEDGKAQADDPVIPFDSAEGLESVLTGNFAAFMQNLFRLRDVLTVPHTLRQWLELLSGLPDLFFRTGDRNYQELAALRETFRSMQEQTESSGAAELVCGLDVIRYLTEKFLQPVESGEPFLRGRITFCSLVPMRSIPMNTIAVLGLDEQSFPRRDISLGFNLVPPEQRRKALVRSRNYEDRYLFLELLLAARSHLLLFYKGRDNKTNKELPPAVPLAELKDALAATFPQLQNHFEIQHSLQAFDSIYFQKNSLLYSYSLADYRACEAFNLRRQTPQNLLYVYPHCQTAWDSSDYPETLQRISPQTLEDFFLNTSRFFLNVAAGKKRVYDDSVILQDEENITPDTLETFLQLTSMLENFNDGMTVKRQYELMRKTNQLPAGSLGLAVFNDHLRRIQRLPAEWLPHLKNQQQVQISLSLGEINLKIEGTIPVSALDSCPYCCRFSKTYSKALIPARIRHLLLCASGRPVVTHVWNESDGKTVHLPALSQPDAIRDLNKLIKCYETGHKHPLPFFPHASFKAYPYTHKGWEDSAKKSFKPPFFGDGDWADPDVQKVFQPEDFNDPVFTDEFAQTGKVFFQFVSEGGLKDD